ncbi:dna-apurinic or apyrimidinic site lyase 2 [Nannochloropsis gaditana]|uniref:DNA-(apurinic or apyrimidinic site) endonuclease 2 n=3 Tax=Nannochloropsis gaditana TaxID=72520 RepID=W7TWD1_9STRA|nr:dna-apurinic or apyrimidinic site lyase 2 [Nannochloropsis gaditana]
MNCVTFFSWNVAALRSLDKGSGISSNAASKNDWLGCKLAALGSPTFVCLQETKISRDMLTEDVATLKHYHAFFAHTHRGVAQGGAYAGVVTYVSKHVGVHAASAGLVCCAYERRKGLNDIPSTVAGKACPFECGIFRRIFEEIVHESDNFEAEPVKAEQKRSAEARRSDGGDAGEEEDYEGCISSAEGILNMIQPEDILRKIDTEGRVVMTDHGHFLLLNVYAPFNGRPGRARFKKAFNAALLARIIAFTVSGREVVLCGDLNAIADAKDSVERPSEEELAAAPWARWMRTLLGSRQAALEQAKGGGKSKDSRWEWLPNECMNWESAPSWPLLVDTFRELHPFRTDAFSCWCNQTAARHTNYGRRIDYILASPGLCGYAEGPGIVAHLEEAAVRQEVRGSDHCPVTARFSFSKLTDGSYLSLPSPFSERGSGRILLPPLCTGNYPEFRARQAGIHTFLLKPSLKVATTPYPSGCVDQSFSNDFLHEKLKVCDPLSPSAPSLHASHEARARQGGMQGSMVKCARTSTIGRKRTKSKSSAAQVPTKSQMTLTHYGIASTRAKGGDESREATEEKMTTGTSASFVSSKALAREQHSSTLYATKSSSLSSSTMSAPQPGVMLEATRREVFLSAFRSQRDNTPRCQGHNEPMVRRHVKKADSGNLGRYFFCCARPVGTDGDKEARCRDFLWEDSLAMGAGFRRVRGLVKKEKPSKTGDV